MNIESIKLLIRDIIVNDLGVGIKPDDVTDHVSLYDDGLGLDSISIINFLVLIEKKFGIQFGENDINSELFKNVENLSEFLQRKLTAQAIV